MGVVAASADGLTEERGGDPYRRRGSGIQQEPRTRHSGGFQPLVGGPAVLMLVRHLLLQSSKRTISRRTARPLSHTVTPKGMPALATWQLPSRRGKLTQHHVMTLDMSGTNAVCCHTDSLAARAGKDAAVVGTLLAEGLGFPEGPVVMPDGAIVLCDGNTGQLLRWSDGAMSTFADTGGSPWGAILGSDGAIYLTQGGNVPGSGDFSAVPGIQRVARGRHGRAARVEHRGPRAGRPERPRVRSRRSPVVHRLGYRAGRPLRPALARAPVRPRLVGRRRDAARAAERLPERHRVRRAGRACTGPSRWRTPCAASRTARRRSSPS